MRESHLELRAKGPNRTWAKIRNAMGRAVFPRKSVGEKVMRVPATFRKMNNNQDVLLPAVWMRWIVKKKGSKGGDLKIISCEFDDIDLIKSAIDKNFSIDIITTIDRLSNYYDLYLNSIYSRVNKKSNYYDLYSDSIYSKVNKKSNLYVIPMRVKQHGVLAKISDIYYLLLDDPHESDELYKSALLVENAAEGFVNDYLLNIFNFLLKKSIKIEKNSSGKDANGSYLTREEAIELEVSLVNELKKIGDDFGNKKEWEKALKAYENAIDIDPQNADVWHNKGDALNNLGNCKEATKAYEKAEEINRDKQFDSRNYHAY